MPKTEYYFTSRISFWMGAQFYSQDTEASYFMWVGAVSVIAGIVLFLCRAPIQKLMRDVR